MNLLTRVQVVEYYIIFIYSGLICNVSDPICNSHSEAQYWYFNGDFMLLLVTVCIVLPLASFKNIEFLGYTSGFSISCMVFFTIVIIAKYFIGTENCPLFDDAVASGSLIYNYDEYYNASDVNWLKNNYLNVANATQKLMSQYVEGKDQWWPTQSSLGCYFLCYVQHKNFWVLSFVLCWTQKFFGCYFLC